MYLLDTNIISDAAKHPKGATAAKISKTPMDLLMTSAIVAAEVRFGLKKQGSQRLTNEVMKVLNMLEVQSFGDNAAAHYGSLRALLEKAGQLIGGNDLLIAAHALELGATLVTDNVREFSRVPGLKVENWLR
jgi:tRNA(fMet)-specific endonuclease VapC